MCIGQIFFWTKQQVAGLALIGQDTLSIIWSIHREAAVQLISLDKEKQTLVQCWRAHYFIYLFLFINENCHILLIIFIYISSSDLVGGMEFGT